MNIRCARLGRPTILTVISTVAFGAALSWMSPAGASATYSNSDCKVLIGARPDGKPRSVSGTSADLAAAADELEGTANKVSNKKLKKGLLLLADIYGEASEASDPGAAASIMLARGDERSKANALYFKALTQCLARSKN